MKSIKSIPLLLCCLFLIPAVYSQIRYIGTLGKYPIELTINYPIEKAKSPAYFKEYKEVSASYLYTKYKKDIDLKGIWDKASNLILVEQSAGQLAMFEFLNYNPKKQTITGTWKTEKKGKEISYPVTLTQKSVKKPIVREQKPIKYQGEVYDEKVLLTLYEPIEQILHSVKAHEVTNLINKIHGSFTYTKQNKTIELKGTWGAKGFLLMGFDKEKNVDVYLDIKNFDKKSNEIKTIWGMVDDWDDGIVFYKNLNITGRSFQKATTNEEYFQVVQYNNRGHSLYALEIYNKRTNNMIKRIDNLDCNNIDLADTNSLKVGDYNFDGLMDIMFLCQLHRNSASSFIILMDPEIGEYYLTKRINSNAKFDAKQKLVITEDYFHDKTTVSYSQWDKGELKIIDQKVFKKRDVDITLSFLISKNSVGVFEKGMIIKQILSMVPQSQVKKKIGFGEFDETYDDYEIYDAENNHLLTLTPSNQNDPLLPISTVKIKDPRFKTTTGIGVGSTYSEVINNSLNLIKYESIMDYILLNIPKIRASLFIKKTDLEDGWWNTNINSIDKSKIPANAKIEHIVVHW